MPTESGRAERSRLTQPTQQELARAFPQLEVLELIGEGGMGLVFKARQRKLDRLVALKILPQALATDSAFAERFAREGRLLARLNHPNIVGIFDFGEADGLFYLLMEYVDGVNLRQAMKAGRFSPAQALAVVPKICEALQYAQNEGIMHRDIKPENILLDTKGRVKIADFGIAKLLGEAGAIGTLTGSGATLGTPQYMAPEQLEKPGEVDHRADVYSLGVVFYEMLTGELPIGRFAAPSNKAAVDPRLDEVVLHTLEKERERRTQSADEVRTQVEGITRTPGMQPVPPPIQGPANVWSQGPDQQSSKKWSIAATVLVLWSLLALPLPLALPGLMWPERIVVLLVLSGIPGLCGTVLGVRSLLRIRGVKEPLGVGWALFPSLTWPLLILDQMFVFGFVRFFVVLFDSFRGTRLAFTLLSYGILAALMVNAPIVWAVGRWARRLPIWRPADLRPRWLLGAALLYAVSFLGFLLWTTATFTSASATIPPVAESPPPAVAEPANTGEQPASAVSQEATNTNLSPAASTDIAVLKLAAADQALKDAEKQFEVGLIPPSDLQKAKLAREIAAAELKKDPVQVAQLKLQVAELDFNVIQKMVEVGKATNSDYEKAKLARDIAAVYLRQVQETNTK